MVKKSINPLDVRSLENSRDAIQSQIQDAKSSFDTLNDKEKELQCILQAQVFKKDLVRSLISKI